jgi:hypothetical protein
MAINSAVLHGRLGIFCRLFYLSTFSIMQVILVILFIGAALSYIGYRIFTQFSSKQKSACEKCVVQKVN